MFEAEIMLKYSKRVLLGDTNPHINDIDDPDACIFLGTINAMGLKQLVNFLTHRGGNTLDAVITESHSKIL